MLDSRLGGNDGEKAGMTGKGGNGGGRVVRVVGCCSQRDLFFYAGFPPARE